jgi:hypothetical protein
MLNRVTMPNENEVKILLPTESEVKKYRFTSIITKTNEKIQEITKIVRKVEIGFMGVENNLYQYQLLCDEFDIEADFLGTALELIHGQHINIFKEVIVQVNQNGTIVSLVNAKDLQMRWATSRQELKAEHQGIEIKNYIEEHDDFFSDEERILKYMRTKTMFGLYFNDCWGHHDVKNPRYEGLQLQLDTPRKTYDRHTLHLAKPYSNNSKIIWKTKTEEKQQLYEFIFKDNQLKEALLEINEFNKTSNYSILCLTK